jgi:hypothetical protein
MQEQAAQVPARVTYEVIASKLKGQGPLLTTKCQQPTGLNSTPGPSRMASLEKKFKWPQSS